MTQAPPIKEPFFVGFKAPISPVWIKYLISLSSGTASSFNETGFYYPGYGAVDQGLAGGTNTIKYYVDVIGATVKATIYLRHNSGSTNTDYVFGTNTTIPSNITLVFEPGARLAIATGITVTINGGIDAGLGQIFSCAGTGSVSFGSGAVKEVYPEWWTTNTIPGTTDMTSAIQAAVNASNNSCAVLSNTTYYITDGITAPFVGMYVLKGEGGGVYGTKGATIKWGGDSTKDVFNLGGGPLYISGVWQGGATWQNNTKLSDFSITMDSGANRIIYGHDIDNLTLERLFIDGKTREDIRGAIDIGGSCGNPILNGITVYDVPKGYGFRFGDGATWSNLRSCSSQKCGLSYWIADVELYENPWATGNTRLEMCNIEGSVISGETPTIKFDVDTVTSGISGQSVINVTDGTLFSAGDCVFIGRGNGNFEMNHVVSVNANQLTLYHQLDYNHSSGEPIKVGTIGVHIGGDSDLCTPNVKLVQCMFNWVGCAVDAHDTHLLEIDTPLMPSKVKRVLYLDGNVVGITMKDPYISDHPQPAGYKFFEITDPGTRGGVFFFTWYGRLDRSGVANPYINNQTDPYKPLNATYFGSDGISGLIDLPPDFNVVQMDYLGIHLRETHVAGTSQDGLQYSSGAPGSEKVWLRVHGEPSVSDSLVLKRNESNNPRMSVGSGGFWLFYNETPEDSCFGVTSEEKIYMPLPVYADNAAALAGGLTWGMLYRTGGDPDVISVVH